jgi:putative ABC transport system ATP-binding protein
MLKLEKIRKSYQSREVLCGLSGTLERGDFVVIMGPNGTGKSTLFDIISGKVAPDSGSIFLNGQDLTQLAEMKRAPLIGRLFQNTYLGACSALTIRENLAMATFKGRRAGLKRGTRGLSEEAIRERLLPLNCNLEALLDVPLGALSGGQRQIIAFIMATMAPPELLLLDEPTAALDPVAATKLLSFAASYAKRQQIPTLLITHDPLIARHLGSRLWIMEEGRIARQFGPEKSEMDPQELFHHIDYGKLKG